VEAERGISRDAIEGLRRRGHQLSVPEVPFGGGQAVLIDWEKGTLTGASDPRKDGMALGY
jgi:gamma-glutamyltranspeptidase/glutathione hydrolase